MRWQKALWDAVNKCDADLIRDILSLDKVQTYLRTREQVYVDEEAPLHLAAYHGHNDLIEMMVKLGMDVDSFNVYSDESGYKVTPLHWAVYKNKGSD
jgi:ankyrin repeat protein